MTTSTMPLVRWRGGELANWPEIESWALANDNVFRVVSDTARQNGLNEDERLRVLVVSLLQAKVALENEIVRLHAKGSHEHRGSNSNAIQNPK